MAAEFLIVDPIEFEPPRGRPFKLLGLSREERAQRMLEFSGLRRAESTKGNGDLLLYPGELVGPARLGYEVAGSRTGEGEVLALHPEGGGRPVVRVSKTIRNSLFTGDEGPKQAYEKALLAVTRHKDLQQPAIPVTNKDQAALAKKVLLGSLRKSVDGLISRTINRPISIFLSSFLVRTPVTPNLLTIITFCIALAAAAMMALEKFVLGVLLMQFASIFDGCDGEVARLKYMSSKLGAWLDTVLDDISTPVFAVASGYGTGKALGGLAGDVLLGLSIVAVVLSIPGYWKTYQRLLLHGTTDSGRVSFSETPNPSPLRRFLVNYLKPFAKRDGYLFIFMLAGVAGLPWMIPILYFIGACLVVGTVITDRSPSNARYGTTDRYRPVPTVSKPVDIR